MSQRQIDELQRIYGGTTTKIKEEINRMHQYYIKNKEGPLLDVIAATVGMTAILHNSSTIDQLPPQMEEAFQLQYPNVDLQTVLESGDFEGYMNGWKGKYFEVLVRDRLNEGEIVGDIQLEPGQFVELAKSPTQAGWDLQIFNSDGSVVNELQLKATDSLSYVKSALDKYPDIDVLTTEELFSSTTIAAITNSGISNQELETDILETATAVSDYGIIDTISEFVPGLPFVLIATTEGHSVLTGRKTLETALGETLKRSAKTGVSVGVGSVVMLLDGGLISIPATIGTKIGLDRIELYKNLNSQINQRIYELDNLIVS